MDMDTGRQDLDKKIVDLEETLLQLCNDHLDGCNSVYDIGFYDITPPEPEDLGERFGDLREGLQYFMSGVLGGPMGGFVIVDKSKADIVNGIGAIPPTTEDLTELFIAPMQDMLQSVNASFYALSDDGELKYERLLKPVIMALSMAAVCIDDQWLILMASWSD